MRRFTLICSLAAVLGLGACATVGPDYALPTSAKIRDPAAQGAFLGAGSAAVSQAPVPDDWWRLYDDPVLNDLIAQALAANTDLRVAAANLERAQAISSEANHAGGLSVTASGAFERARESGEQFLLFEPLPADNLGDVGIKVGYQIDLVGRLKRAREAAGADTQAASAAADAARITVVADVARAYVDACAAGRQLAVAQQTVDLQARSLDVTRRLVGAGRGTALDITRAQAQLDQLRAAAPSFEAQRRAQLYKLAVLTGRPPAQFPQAVATCADIPRLTRPIPAGDGAALLRRRPDVRQAERTLAGATARVGVAMGALYPTISLGFSTGSTGLLADLGQPAANRWSFGSLINWTMPGGGERARIRQADAGASLALARFDGVVLNALRETETSLSAYAHELDRNAALRATNADATLASSQATRLYASGRAPYLAGLDARRTEAGAAAALAASDAQLADDQITLFLALGGGWKQAGAQP